MSVCMFFLTLKHLLSGFRDLTTVNHLKKTIVMDEKWYTLLCFLSNINIQIVPFRFWKEGRKMEVDIYFRSG